MYQFIALLFCFSAFSFSSTTTAQSPNPTPEVLLGEWKLDMTPMDNTDGNFAMMRIIKIDENKFQGIFYREGVIIKEGRLNTQTDVIYGALVSGDNSGKYNSTFYYKDGMLYGSTHAIDRDFLAVWTATKVE